MIIGQDIKITRPEGWRVEWARSIDPGGSRTVIIAAVHQSASACLRAVLFCIQCTLGTSCSKNNTTTSPTWYVRRALFSFCLLRTLFSSRTSFETAQRFSLVQKKHYY